jgi:hypothetical protein
MALGLISLMISYFCILLRGEQAMSYFQTIRRREPPKPSFELLRPHFDVGHELIPLKPLSEEPLHFDWPSMRPLTEHKARAYMAAGGNIGVRLRPDMLVIDVKHHEVSEGTNPIKRLETHLGISLSQGPLVLTGGAGQHFYFRKHPNCRIRSSLFGFPDLFLKSSIGYVVASGSVHPVTHEHYHCEFSQDPPSTPSALLNESERQGAGYVSSPEWPTVFSRFRMDPDEQNLFLFMRTFRLERGEPGREAFVEWAVSHAKYALCRERIEALWSSLEDDRVDLFYCPAPYRGPRLEIPRSRPAGHYEIAPGVTLIT